MSDPTTIANTSSSGNGESASAADKARALGAEVKERVSGFADASIDTLKDQASTLLDATKGIASKAGEQLQSSVQSQKAAGADYLGNVAQSMRRAAREFESEVPMAASYILQAAAQVETVSSAVKDRDIGELIRNTQDFARRQPTAFLGLAVLAGFGVVRFLKSSGGSSGSDERGSSFSPSSSASTHNASLQGRRTGGDTWSASQGTLSQGQSRSTPNQNASSSYGAASRERLP